MTANELFNILLPRLSKEPAVDSFLGGLNNAILVVARRLLYRKSSLLKESYSCSFSANTAIAALPEGYMGFCPDAPPTASGRSLFPLPPFKYGTYSEAGAPEFYDTRSGLLNIYPTPSEAVSVAGLYFKRPDRLVTMSDDIPWYGAIDDLLGEAILVMAKTGQWGSLSAEWEALINREVDKLQASYSNKMVTLMDVSLLAR